MEYNGVSVFETEVDFKGVVYARRQFESSIVGTGVSLRNPVWLVTCIDLLDTYPSHSLKQGMLVIT